MRIGVSGAGGKLGGAIVASLHKRGDVQEVVAISRTPAEMPPRTEARLGDYDRPETLAAAYADLDRLLLIPSADLRPGMRAAQIVAAVDAAVAAGVGHIYLLSACGTRRRSEPAMGAAYWAGEQRLVTSKAADWTIMRMNYFAETLAEQAGMAAATGHLPGLAENRVAFVSRQDVAEACAGALATPGHEGAIYNLTGPDRVTGAERAVLLGEFTGRQIDYIVLGEEQLRDAMSGSGLPPFVIDAVASMNAAQAEGDYDIVSGDVEKLAGRAPRALREVLAAAAFEPADPEGGA